MKNLLAGPLYKLFCMSPELKTIRSTRMRESQLTISVMGLTPGVELITLFTTSNNKNSCLKNEEYIHFMCLLAQSGPHL